MHEFDMTEFDTYEEGKSVDHGNGISETHIDGSILWKKNDLLHRDDDKPASITSFTHGWYKNGRTHRENGPAIITKNEMQLWYQDGVLHRENAPAVIRPNGEQEWWLSGEKLSESIVNSIILNQTLTDELQIKDNSSTHKKHKL